MQAIIESSPAPNVISQLDARQVAQQYVAAQIDPRFTVNNGEHYSSQSLGRALWRFIICQEQDPLAALMVDAQTGQVIALTQAEIQVVREKAAIYTARKQGVLPVNERGYVLGEYARREADGYLGDNIGMFFNAVDSLFLAGPQARWQVTIVFKRYSLGPFTLGVMDVDARTGAPISLTRKQIHQLKERARAIMEFHAQTAAA